MTTERIDLDIEGVRRFHGHWCPGLARGIRVAEAALREVGPSLVDEEVVCITEADHCGVDAIQFLTGCTFGKGNLIHRDYGKSVFTFIRRSDGVAVRISARAGWRPAHDAREDEIRARVEAGEPVSDEDRHYFDGSRERYIESIVSAPLAELFDVRRVHVEIPDMAKIHDSIVCSRCGEMAMSSRVRHFAGRPYCWPCYEAMQTSESTA